MSIKTILAPLDGSEKGAEALATASALAERFGAHLDVLHVRADARDTIPMVGEGMSGAMIDDLVRAASSEIERREATAREQFESLSETARANASWRSLEGRVDETVALQGRLADLIVLPRPTADDSVAAAMTVQAAMVDTGRGVMLSPPGGVAAFGKKVAIAWNGSAEAARAVTAAMPLIHEAEKVLVLTVDLDQNGNAEACNLGDYLKRHGIEADIETTPAIAHDVGDTVLSTCASWGADVLVMGAYTHSRLRQLIFGGVTRHVLDNATIPVILVH